MYKYLTDRVGNLLELEPYFPLWRSLNATEVATLYNSTVEVYTGADLGASVRNGTDVETENLTYVYNWKVDDESIAVLNMPCEGGSQDGNESGVADGVKDYSDFGNNGTVYNATWNSTGGHDGFGAYEFDGVGDRIEIADSQSLSITGDLTIAWWQYDLSGTGGAFHKSYTGEYSFRPDSGGRLVFFHGNGSDYSNFYTNSSHTVWCGL